LKQLHDRQEARKTRGYNRAKNSPYLYSGLLYCGVCGSQLKADGPVQYAAYVCPDYRIRRGCTNLYRIRQDRAAAQITQQLSSQLTDLPFFDSLVATVYGEVKDEWARQKAHAECDDLPQLENARRDCQRWSDRLLDTIENAGPGDPVSETLSARLRQRYFEMERLES
jgi:Recombinase zinc beta ribbon domain